MQVSPGAATLPASGVFAQYRSSALLHHRWQHDAGRAAENRQQGSGLPSERNLTQDPGHRMPAGASELHRCGRTFQGGRSQPPLFAPLHEISGGKVNRCLRKLANVACVSVRRSPLRLTSGMRGAPSASKARVDKPDGSGAGSDQGDFVLASAHNLVAAGDEDIRNRGSHWPCPSWSQCRMTAAPITSVSGRASTTLLIKRTPPQPGNAISATL